MELPLDDAAFCLLASLAGLRDAKIDEFDLAFIGQKNILWTDIPVNQVEWAPVIIQFVVSVVEAGGHLLTDESNHVERERNMAFGAVHHHLIDIFSVDELHGDEIHIFDAAKIENLGNVDVIELHRDLSFIDKHIDELLVLHKSGVNHFESEIFFKPTNTRRLGKIDLRHSAYTDAFD